ncbi:MAG: enoyl-CoA hydratase/isomerase family protein [Candidatus Helarchaeota archaeon]|nr:enoyl-CoA hydratase/isomerase family protein [Candidatus Helarchaeota archaeon]
MSEDMVLIETDDEKKITTIKMNRLKKKNALNFDLYMGIQKAIEEVERSDARVVILTGGEDTFSAGIDLKMLTGQAQGQVNAPTKPQNFRFWLNTWLQPIMTKIEKMEKPVIAKINGYCFGAGFELALACDFRFAVSTATFTMPESRVGIITDVGGTIRLTRLVGITVAKDIIMTGRTFGAPEALKMGILSGVAKDQAELDQMVLAYADELIEAAPLAVGMAKRLVQLCHGKDVEYGNELEGLVNSQLLQTKDFFSGAFARLEKKKPRWRGK